VSVRVFDISSAYQRKVNVRDSGAGSRPGRGSGDVDRWFVAGRSRSQAEARLARWTCLGVASLALSSGCLDWKL